MTEVRRYVPCPTCTANRPRLCDLHYQQRAEAFLQAVKHAIADPRTPDGVKATYEELLAQNRSPAARVQELERELGELKEKAYRYAHWTPEHTIEEWLADRQRIVEAKQVEADAALRQQLAEAQETIIRKDEALGINRQAHGIVRDQLTQAEQQVARLREACEPLVAIYAEESTATDSPYFDGPILTKAQVRAIQHALRETGA